MAIITVYLKNEKVTLLVMNMTLITVIVQEGKYSLLY